MRRLATLAIVDDVADRWLFALVAGGADAVEN
jgi:hypothetical protein